MDDNAAWAIFWVCFIGLAAFDMTCLAPQSGGGGGAGDTADALSGRTAILHVAFWFCVGLVFNAAVWGLFGTELGVVWFNGYILEYLLSMDNVFFFHVVFTSYATPQTQVYKGLFLGILGAVVLRLVFYIVGSEFFRLAFFVQILFGLVLIYSGYKTAASDEDDDDPRENKCVQAITRFLPLTGEYDDRGALFTKVAVRPHDVDCPPELIGSATTVPENSENCASRQEAGSLDDSPAKMVWRGTMLLLVVVVLQVVDIIFAVDSVTAKIAEHDSTFINFSSSAFAMLCLRSMYFVLTRLLKYFRFLKYGVAAILVLIGLKLMINPWYRIREMCSLGMICTVFFFSVMLSVIVPPADGGGEEGVEMSRNIETAEDQS